MIGKGSSTSLERTSGSDRSGKTGNESSTGDTLPAVTGRPNAYEKGRVLCDKCLVDQTVSAGRRTALWRRSVRHRNWNFTAWGAATWWAFSTAARSPATPAASCCGRWSGARTSWGGWPGAFEDHRRAERVEHPVERLVKRVLGICLGYEDLNDHDELCRDRLLALLCECGDIDGAGRRQEADRGKPLAGNRRYSRKITPQ